MMISVYTGEKKSTSKGNNILKLQSEEVCKKYFELESAYEKRFDFLKNIYKQKLLEKERLVLLNKENEFITEGFMKTKRQLEKLKSDLQRKLFLMNLKLDKDKLLYKKKLDIYSQRQILLQCQYKNLPMERELNELLEANKILNEKCNNMNNLLECTKTQFDSLFFNKQNISRMKVFEFCEEVFQLKLMFQKVSSFPHLLQKAVLKKDSNFFLKKN